MSAKQTTSSSKIQRYTDLSVRGGMAAPTGNPADSQKSIGSMSVAGAPHRRLPPLQQSAADRARAVQYQPNLATPQLPAPGRSLRTVQHVPAAQPHSAPQTGNSYQYQRVSPTAQGTTRSIPNPYSAYTQGSTSGPNQGAVNGYSSTYNVSTQDAYRGNNLQPLNIATGYDTHNLPYTGSSRPPATSPRSAQTSESLQSQNWQPVGTPGQTRNTQEDIISRYQLRVRQQPQAARACGFGERDRRVLDPPPIVQLSLVNYDPSSPSDVSELKYAHFVVHCTLLSVSAMGRDGQDVTAVPEPNNAGKLTRKMTGTLVASPFTATDPDAPALADHNARLACFFIFSDLSCRQVGRYRLRFNIMKISGEHLIQSSTLPVLRSVESDEFEVYSAKDFPGMKASTSLIRDLKRQGALVSVKKGIEARKQEHSKTGSSTSDGNAEEEREARARPSASNGGQRQRRR